MNELKITKLIKDNIEKYNIENEEELNFRMEELKRELRIRFFKIRDKIVFNYNPNLICMEIKVGGVRLNSFRFAYELKTGKYGWYLYMRNNYCVVPCSSMMEEILTERFHISNIEEKINKEGFVDLYFDYIDGGDDFFDAVFLELYNRNLL